MIDATKLTIDDIERVYSGRIGCMCGCRGDYKDSPRSKKIILNKILKSRIVEVSDDVVFTQTENGRILAAYLTPEYMDEMVDTGRV